MKLFPLLYILLFRHIISGDEEICENSDNCFSAPIQSKDYLCCKSKLTTSNDHNCIYKYYYDYEHESNPRMKALKREKEGDACIRENNCQESGKNNNPIYEVSCVNDSNKYIYSDDYFTYSKSDIDTLKSNNHCFYYHYNVDSKDITEEKCKNADLLQTSRDTGIECGYFIFNFKFENGNELTYKTCYVVNIDGLKGKTLNEENEEEMREIGDDGYGTEYGDAVSYSFELKTSNDFHIKYNSITGEVIQIKDNTDLPDEKDNGEDKEENNEKDEEKENAIYIYKIRFLYLLLNLLLF